MYNILAPKKISSLFNKSKYFKQKLGRSISVNDNEVRKFLINDSDTFVKFYFDKYKVLVQSEGSIGSINIYTDHYITEDDLIVVYYKESEFVFKHEPNKYKELGIDNYIGSIIKEIETKYIDEIDEANNIKKKEEKTVDPTKLFTNPGSVSYEDIIAYQKSKKVTTNI